MWRLSPFFITCFVVKIKTFSGEKEKIKLKKKKLSAYVSLGNEV